MIQDEKLEGILFYLIEKADKVGRKYAQEQFANEGWDITKDQWLVLKKIADNTHMSQVELAKSLFKDTASINRILSLMTTKRFVKKEANESDKRQIKLSLTTRGEQLFQKMLPKVIEIRKKGVDGFSSKEIDSLRSLLTRLIQNLA